MELFRIHVTMLILLGLLVLTTPSYGESSTCLMLYEEGGAPAVFQSPKCPPHWKHSDYVSHSRSTWPCQTAVLQGRRKSLEDRTVCALEIRIPFPGKVGIKEVTVGVAAVFDGHNGAEASDMASKLLLEYFVLHTYFLLHDDATYSAIMEKASGTGRLETGKQHHTILKEALLRAVHDIDAKFSEEASRENIVSGSTATIILLADGQILVANIGDSKAFLCSETFQSPAEAKATYFRLHMKERMERRNGAIPRLRNHKKFELASPAGSVHFSVKELTRDHHPDRDDEKFRVESAGGYVLEWGGVPRVNGQLAISRSIGDVSLKRFGVISAPELTDWQPLTVNDTYLVAASDGVFEKQSLQEVCDLLWEAQSSGLGRSELSSSCSYSLADCIVSTAFDRGSMDNMAAVVVPLVSTSFSHLEPLRQLSLSSTINNTYSLGDCIVNTAFDRQ